MSDAAKLITRAWLNPPVAPLLMYGIHYREVTRTADRVGSSQVFVCFVSSAPALVFHLALVADAHMSADAYSWFVVVSGLKNKALADGCFSAKPKTIYSSITMVTHTHLITRSLLSHCNACQEYDAL